MNTSTIQKAKAPPPSRLAAIRAGQLRRPLRCLFYGPEGVGKSSLAADAPAPIFLDVEGGADNLDVARYPFRDEAGGHIPRTFGEVLAAIDDLATNVHDYQTVVIDTVDALESLIHRQLCADHGKSSIEDFGYGKGYVAALDVFRLLTHRLETLRDRGLAVLLVGHASAKTYKNPLGEDYDRFQLRVHDKAGGLLKEWCDVVGFIRFDEGAAKLKGDTAQTKRARGYSTGARLVHLSRTAAWDAKARLGLPAEFELDAAHPWAPFAAATSAARDATGDDLHGQIAAELARLGAAFTTDDGRTLTAAAITTSATGADRSTLTRILNGLRASAPKES